ncbi:D-hexose-6-phosphate mutarotase [Ectopseudomonas mendocina]|uniref:Putative glucose-6-phosphate 1-epimerase n=1 Tax=Ectopseudomonas mendocina TaxID=300 RepID=A0ABZ2RKH9_ECTME
MPRPSVERIQLDELTCWQIRHADKELLISQQGAQILSYKENGRPLVWLSDQAAFKQGQPVRGGVPICWPWFANLEHNPEPVQTMHNQPSSATAHGFVRSLGWQLQGIETEGNGVRLDFVFDTRLHPQPDWPYAAQLHFQVRLDDRLHMALTTCNLSDTTLRYSQALHSYFAVSDIRQVKIEGLQGHSYLDCLDGWSRKHQTDEPVFSAETDRVYLDTPAAIAIIDDPWGRKINLLSSGSRSAVVWNPWTEKSLRLTQFAHNAWQGMLCIEHANAAEDFQALESGEQHTLSVSIWSS